MPQTRPRRRDSEWKTANIPAITGGLNTSIRPDQLPDNQCPQMKNMMLKDEKLTQCTGYKRIGELDFFAVTIPLFGTPKKSFRLENTAGTISNFLVTDKTVYRWVENIATGAGSDSAWRGIPVNGGANSTADQLNSLNLGARVASTAGFQVGDTITVEYTNAATTLNFWVTTINSIGANFLFFDDIPSGSPIQDIGDEVYVSPTLAGDDDHQVVVQIVDAQAWMVCTNGVDFPFYIFNDEWYDMSTILLYADTVCQTLGYYQGVLMMGNILENGDLKDRRVRWSDIGDPTEWDPAAAASSAGFVDLVDTRDPIRAIAPMGQDNYIYGSRSAVRQEFLGTEAALFNFRTVLFGEDESDRGVGVVSQNALHVLEDHHIILGPNGVYEYRGGFSVQPVSDPIFTRYFNKTGEIDPTKYPRCFLHYFEEQRELFVFYATRDTDFPDRALVLDKQYGRWRYREFPEQITMADNFFAQGDFVPWQDLVGSWAEAQGNSISAELEAGTPRIILGLQEQDATAIYDYVTTRDDGVAIPWSVTTKEISAVDREVRLDFVDVQLAGQSVKIEVTMNSGASFFTLGTVSPGARMVRTRLHRQRVGESIQVRLSGNGGGPEVGSIAVMYREENKMLFSSV